MLHSNGSLLRRDISHLLLIQYEFHFILEPADCHAVCELARMAG